MGAEKSNHKFKLLHSPGFAVNVVQLSSLSPFSSQSPKDLANQCEKSEFVSSVTT